VSEGKQLKHYDIAIVGAGVIGSALALQLSRSGYAVALIDALEEAFPATNPERVIALSEGSAQFLQSLGVWESILGLGAGWIKDIYVCEPGQPAVVDMSHTEINAEALGYVLEIRHVLKPLHDALVGHVDFICPARVSQIHKQESHVQITLDSASGLQHLQEGLLVGADGTNSQIRNLAKMTTLGWDHNRLGIVASVASSQGHGDVAYECFREEGPLALLPLADGRFSLVWSVAPKHGVQLMDMSETEFLSALADEVGESVIKRIGSLERSSPRAVFPLELRIAKSFAQNGIVLVGNAAHTIHPIAGQGMNLGLRDVMVLADVLSKPRAKDKLNSPLLTDAYAERRRLDTAAVATFTEGTLHAFSSPLLPTKWLRGVGLSVTQSTPALKQILLQQASGLGQQQRMQR